MQLRQYIKQGIPDDMRGQIWIKMIGSQAVKAISSFDYQVMEHSIINNLSVWAVISSQQPATLYTVPA